MRYVGTYTMRDAMTGYRKISRYQLESGTSWFGRLWQAFREKLSSGHACIYRASLILFDPTIRVSTRIYVRFRVCILKQRVPASCTNFLRIDLVHSIVLHEHFDFLCV